MSEAEYLPWYAASGLGSVHDLESKKKQAAVQKLRATLSNAFKKLRVDKGPKRIESLGMGGQVGLAPGGALPGFQKLGSLISLKAFSDEIYKLGEGYPEPPKRPEKKPTHPLMVGAQSAAGLGIGMAAGYGVAKALENIARKKGLPMDKIFPLAVAGAGALGAMASPMLYAYERKKMEDYARQRT
jgi:hypothetical protein